MRLSLALAGVLALSSAAAAQSDSQDVRIYATSITGLVLDDDAVDLPLDDLSLDGTHLVGTATSGLSIESNLLLYKISAQLDSDYSGGVTLSAFLNFTGITLPGGVNPLQQTLSASESKDLVVGLVPLVVSDVGVEYEASAPLDVGTDYDETNTVTYTITSILGL